MAKLRILTDGFVTRHEVTLSERNLLSLLSKLYTPGSKCELENSDTPDPILCRLVLKGEKDNIHYNQVQRLPQGSGPGMMHPLTEAFIQLLKDLETHPEDTDYVISKEKIAEIKRGIQ